MKRILFAAVMLAGFSATPALAQTKVGDWTIEKRTQDQHCNAARGYKDADDENREYVMVLSYSDKAIVMVVIYCSDADKRFTNRLRVCADEEDRTDFDQRR